jgi:SAM-dependent methyltransferase
MGNEFKGQTGHSAEHFGDTRDHWWNREFLELMAKRWNFAAMHTVLDVGAGVGHWGTTLASVMPEDVRITGIEREALWVQKAASRAQAQGLGARFSYLQGDAQQLPFDDNSFDMVTCQTVLIHLKEPAACIAEMQRVAKPGGLVMVAEPNNLTESLLLDSITNLASVDEIVDLVRLQLTCERGKVALGQGDNSLGDRVPGMFAALGLVDVQVFVNDKATALFPPYAKAEQHAYVEDLRDRAARRIWNWSKADARRLFVAGGGAESAFDELFERALASRDNIVGGIESGRYHGIVGGEFYLIGGRKPWPPS